MFISSHFQNWATTCRDMPKCISDTNIFAAEATVTSLALGYYRRKGPVQRDAVIVIESGLRRCHYNNEQGILCDTA